MLETNVQEPNAATKQPQPDPANSKGPFFLGIERNSRSSSSIVKVIHEPTGKHVFIDSFDINAFRWRLAFVKNLLDAFEAFVGYTLSAEQRKTIAAALHARLLRATVQLSPYDFVYEQIDELNQITPLAS